MAQMRADQSFSVAVHGAPMFVEPPFLSWATRSVGYRAQNRPNGRMKTRLLLSRLDKYAILCVSQSKVSVN